MIHYDDFLEQVAHCTGLNRAYGDKAIVAVLETLSERIGSKGAGDLENAVWTAVVNKRAGGTGLISGRKAFQRPMKEGIQLLNAIQDVYLSKEVTVV